MIRRESLALFIAAVLLFSWRDLREIAPLFIVIPLFVLSLRFQLGWIAIAALVFVGIGIRLQPFPVGSDVLDVTRAAVAQAAAGGNPYGHGFDVSRPPGAAFPYGPLALLWYALLPRFAELVAGIAVLLVLAWKRSLVGLALYATAVPLVLYVSNGANDVGAGALILVGLVVAERWPSAGAAILGLSGAFKLYGLAWLPPMAGYGGPRRAFTYIGFFIVGWLPAIVLWGLGPIVWSVATSAGIHASPFLGLATMVDGHDPLLFNAIAIAAGTLVAIWSLRARTVRQLALGGSGIFLAVLYLGWWSSISYLAAIAPAICWQLDGWLFAESEPV